nr:hypothetical protein CFP56_13014 [Quercus suber]
MLQCAPGPCTKTCPLRDNRSHMYDTQGGLARRCLACGVQCKIAATAGPSALRLLCLWFAAVAQARMPKSKLCSIKWKTSCKAMWHSLPSEPILCRQKTGEEELQRGEALSRRSKCAWIAAAKMECVSERVEILVYRCAARGIGSTSKDQTSTRERDIDLYVAASASRGFLRRPRYISEYSGMPDPATASICFRTRLTDFVGPLDKSSREVGMSVSISAYASFRWSFARSDSQRSLGSSIRKEPFHIRGDHSEATRRQYVIDDITRNHEQEWQWMKANVGTFSRRRMSRSVKGAHQGRSCYMLCC